MCTHTFRTITMIKLASIIILTLIQPIDSLIAYDCESPTANVSVLSIRDVGKCPNPRKDYTEDKIYVQIVQKNDFTCLWIQTCLIEVTRLIQKCGMFSHVSAVHQGLFTYVKSTSPDECRTIHLTRTFKTGTGRFINNIEMNSTTTFSTTITGSVNLEGSCEGGTYIENSITWNDVVVIATYKIHVREYYATVRLDTNEIVLQGGIVCSYTTGQCMDNELGTTIWDRSINDRCSENSITILYEGQASYISINQTDLFSDSKYIVVEQDDRVFALSLIGKSNICHREAWITEHPRLMVLENYATRFISTYSTPMNPRNIDLFTYMNTKFMYVEQTFKRSLRNLHVQIVYRRCLLRRETLKNRLLMAPLATNAVTMLLQDSTGYMGRVLGEVIYIIQCTPKIVQIRRTDNCYNELPVTADNKSLFMATVTRILQNRGEQIDCSHLTPPLYKIDNHWIGFRPQPGVGNIPKEVPATEEPQLSFQPVQRLGAGGIYTNDEIQNAQRNLLFGKEREAVSNLITRKIIGLEAEPQDLDTVNLFNEKEIQNLARTAIKHLWGWFTDIGMFTAGLMGIYFVIRILKFMISTVVNGITIYQTVEWSVRLIACLWNTLTMWVMHQELRKNQNNETKRNDDHTSSEVLSAVASETPTNQNGDTHLYPKLTIKINDQN